MATRIVKQVKVFDIASQSDYRGGHGYSERIPGISWVNGQIWESDEVCQSLLKEATIDWQKRCSEDLWGTTSHRPTIEIYWQTIDIKEIGD